MPFINVGSGNDVILEIPTDRTNVWGTRFKNNFATPIAEHDHSGSGKGRLLTASSFSANSISGAKIRLLNNEYLRARDAGNTADVNIIKVNASDELEFGIDLATLNVKNDAYIKVRNNADSAYINLLKVNTSDKIAIGADLANLAMIGDTYIQGRNNADSAYINLIKVNTTDEIEFGVDTIHTGSITLEDYLTQVDVTFALADNQSGAANITGALVTEAEGYSFDLHYSIYVDATTDLLEKGIAKFTYVNSAWQQARVYQRDDSEVVFSVASGQLKYTTPTYAGYSAATLTYRVEEL